MPPHAVKLSVIARGANLVYQQNLAVKWVSYMLRDADNAGDACESLESNSSCRAFHPRNHEESASLIRIRTPARCFVLAIELGRRGNAHEVYKWSWVPVVDEEHRRVETERFTPYL